MDLENYTFMGFVWEYYKYLASISVATVGILFGLKSKEPKAFEKVKNYILPACWMILGVILLILLLFVRFSIALDGYSLERAISNGLIIEENALERIKSSLEFNRQIALSLDLVWFCAFVIITLEKAIAFISWFLRGDEESAPNA